MMRLLSWIVRPQVARRWSRRGLSLFLLLWLAGACAPAVDPVDPAGDQEEPAAAAEVASSRPRTTTRQAFPSVDGPDDPRAVTFVAYNLLNYLKMDRRVDGRMQPEKPKPEAEIEALLAMLAGCQPDILGVSEIGSEEDTRDLRHRLAGIGIDLPHLVHVDGSDPVRNLALLSKFPVVATDHQTDLHYNAGGRRLPFQRGILDATVEINPDYRLRLIGSHFKSKREVDFADHDEMRRNEAELTRRHIEKILRENPQTNLLLFGDFNDTKNNPAFSILKGGAGRPDSLDDLWLRDQYGLRWTHYWRTADLYSRIDYIFFSRGLAPEILRNFSRIHYAPEWELASDHRPLVVYLIPQEDALRRRR